MTNIMNNVNNRKMNNVKVGDYILLGKYNSEPILWRIIQKENNKLLLFSEYIVTYKCFDSKQSIEYTNDSDRQNYGSNCWETSNIRQWLNSDEEKVSYDNSPPTKDGVWSGYNGYSEEAGFLYHFTELEKNSILTVNHEVLLSEIDKSNKEYGNEIHIFEDAYPDIAIRNYEKSYGKNIEDKVFLLSIKEVSDYIQNRNWEWIRKPTSVAASKDETNNKFNWYWLRSVTAGDSHGVRVVSIDGYLGGRSAYRGTIGIAPALWINQENLTIKLGNGTKESPYLFN